MSLNLNPLFEDMVRQFQTVTSDDRFRSDFVSSVNKVLDELYVSAELGSAISHVNNYDSTISELNSDDMYIMSAGLVYNLIISGREHVIRDNAYQIAKAEWEERKGDYMIKKSREDQSALDDDLTGDGASIVGLGDVTDIDYV